MISALCTGEYKSIIWDLKKLPAACRLQWCVDAMQDLPHPLCLVMEAFCVKKLLVLFIKSSVGISWKQKTWIYGHGKNRNTGRLHNYFLNALMNMPTQLFITQFFFTSKSLCRSS